MLAALRLGDLPRPVLAFAGVVFRRLAVGTDALPDVEAAEALLGMLDERDFAAAAIAPLLAEAAAADASGRVLGAVLQRLGPESALPARQCALDVAEQLLLLLDAAGPSEGGAEAEAAARQKREAVEAPLAAALLLTLGDVELQARLQASRVFGLVTPTPGFLRALVETMGSREPRASSAAAEALLRSLEGGPDAFSGLLGVSAASAPSADENGNAGAGELGAVQEAAPTAAAVGRGLGKVGRVLERWAQGLGGQLPERCAQVLARMVLAHPRCPELVQLASAASVCCLGAHPGAVFVEVQEALASSPPASASGAGAEGSGAVFERLSPLLLLKVLPLAAFGPDASGLLYGLSGGNGGGEGGREGGAAGSMGGAEGSIAASVAARVTDASEAEDVRRVAAEVFGRFHPDVALPHLAAVLGRNTVDSGGGAPGTEARLQAARSCLFSICHNFMAYGFRASGGGPGVAARRSICGAALTALAGLAERRGLSEGEAKLRLGCVDCLATAAFAELHFSSGGGPAAAKDGDSAGGCEREAGEEGGLTLPGEGAAGASAPLIVELEPGAAAPEMLDVFVRGASGGGRAALAPLVRADALSELGAVWRMQRGLCHALILASKRLQTPSSRRSMALHTFPALLRAAAQQQEDGDGRSAALQCAQLQVLYTSLYHLGSTNVLPFVEEAMALAIALLRGQDRSKDRPQADSDSCPAVDGRGGDVRAGVEVRAEAAKLLTAVLASSDGALEACSHLLVEARRAVGAAAAAEPPEGSAALRGICEQLLRCMAP